MLIKRVPIPTDIDRNDYNNNLLFEFEPYCVSNDNNTIIIDDVWWNGLSLLGKITISSNPVCLTLLCYG